MITNTVLGTSRTGRTVDIETARTERSVAIEEAFHEVSGSSGRMGVVISTITSGDVAVIIVSIKMTTAFVVSITIDDGTRRVRGGIGDGGSSSRNGIIYFTVGSRAVPIARGHPGARWGTNTIVVYLVSY